MQACHFWENVVKAGERFTNTRVTSYQSWGLQSSDFGASVGTNVWF